MATIREKTQHFNDWPNSAGFDVRYEELSPKELEVEGAIPAYTAGVLFRNGLGPREVVTDKKNTFRTNHWFDAFAQVHRFQIHPPDPSSGKVRVTHNSRRTCDGLVQRVIKTGDRAGFTFAARYDPCLSFFQKLQSFFRSTPEGGPSDDNVGVTLSANFPGLSGKGQKLENGHSSKLSTLCNKTDATRIQMLDPESLEPIGLANQSVLHEALKGPTSGAHAKVCPETGDVYNYNLEFGGKNGTYRVFHVSASTGKTSILSTIKAPAAYLHSTFLTEHYIILCVWNSHFSAGGASLLWTKNYLDALSNFDRSNPATWYVIDRKPVEQGGEGLIATYDSEPFFCFHSINAYEEPSSTEPGKTDIIADCCAYENLDVLKRFYLENLMSDSPQAKPYADPSNKTSRAEYRRFKLPDVPTKADTKATRKAVSVFTEERGKAPELPSLANSVRTRKHRYVYGVIDTGKSTFFDGLIKYDMETRTTKTWSVFGQSAGEPIFIADPDSNDEDGGVLLTVVLDGTKGKSYLLVLDAKNLEEVGRANVDGIVGFGFHGTHVGTDGVQSQL